MVYRGGLVMNLLADKIKNCNTQKELDSLRIEIARDKDNFEENQKLFIKKKNSLKRQGKYYNANITW
jgi:hypothetical protein